ncbi:nuclear transport factor 2 family protein [Kitasatospora purpeofusca]|uniref:nuclear transport factor 2 family protein n=1 Tax=Kitasatospora purpeofusca TaxID=67352 RepID=UPI0038637A26|nr:nuclear transport factor 2 family protein [Kitasatospora purpeofusca]
MSETGAQHYGAVALRHQYEAMTVGDMEQVVRHFAADLHYEEPSLGVVAHSPGEIAKGYQPWLTCARFTFPVLDAFGAGTRAALRWEMHGTILREMPGLVTPDHIGRTFIIHGATTAQFNDEQLIDRCGCYWDLGSFSAQFR